MDPMTERFDFLPLDDRHATAAVGDILVLGAEIAPSTDARAATRDFSAACVGVTESGAVDEGEELVVAQIRHLDVHAASAADSRLVVLVCTTPGVDVADDTVSAAMRALLLSLHS